MGHVAQNNLIFCFANTISAVALSVGSIISFLHNNLIF